MLSYYRLPGKMEGEEIIKVIRKDVFIMFKRIINFVLQIVLPILFFMMLQTIFPDIMQSPIGYPLLIVLGGAYFLFIWLLFFFSFIDYYLNLWVITNYRIIDVHQEGFFARTISEQGFDKVQDITSEVQGIFPTIFKYGMVYVQTAGEKERFTFIDVPDPDDIRDMIIQFSQQRKKEKEA